ncbi:MAG: UDP-N-acetylmuramoyl-L-alanyl-D-glutamate--2,6-diaminopimelate ligase [Thermodesulfobacteriota bacterium]
MELRKLLEGVEIKRIAGDPLQEIKGIAYHSKRVEEGFLFVAIRGFEFDGHQFTEEAIKRGAKALLLEEGREGSDRTMAFVANSRQALAKVASNFYGNPSAKVKLVGITGTNGKTTTAHLLESIFKKAGYSVGVIGTINYRYGQKVIPASNTTPESLDLQGILAEMVREGVSHVIMEVSSHGLDLDRVWACQFDHALFTNFTSDHLDYHKTLEHYFKSKRKLFAECLRQSQKPRRFAVTNSDDPRGEEMVEGIDLPVIRYGLGASCDVTADQMVFTFDGLACRLKTPQGICSIHSPLVGRHNLYNILAAVAMAIGMDLPLRTAKEGVEALERVSGRFEKVENRKGINVVVDYAHTQDALERVLSEIRNIQRDGKIITVFGCGGDRDRTKRPLMGAVAGTYSDLTILTSDNPRTEDPLAIMDEVERGLRSLPLEEWHQNDMGAWRMSRGYLKIRDRKEAIQTAIRLAHPLDTVLIAGKGHENYQIIGKQTFPFDDRVEAQKALEER